VTDAAANLVAFVPSLGTREVVGFGEGFPLPTRLTFKALPAERVPRSETFRSENPGAEALETHAFVKQVVERWRGAAGAKALVKDEAVAEAALEARAPIKIAPAPAAPISPAVAPTSTRIEQIRAQLLRR
jgi:hypothetical protein